MTVLLGRERSSRTSSSRRAVLRAALAAWRVIFLPLRASDCLDERKGQNLMDRYLQEWVAGARAGAAGGCGPGRSRTVGDRQQVLVLATGPRPRGGPADPAASSPKIGISDCAT